MSWSKWTGAKPIDADTFLRLAAQDAATCPRCKGWGSIKTSRRVVGEPGTFVSRICKACDGSGRTR